MVELVILGAGNFGREIVMVMDSEGFNADPHHPAALHLAGFLDDTSPDVERLERIGVPLLGRIELLEQNDWEYVIGVGDPKGRMGVDAQALGLGASAARAIRADTARVGRDVEIGDGTVITHNVVITTNVRIGRHAHINLSTTIGHDCIIGDFVTISPGVNLSGNVRVEDGVYLGTNCSVLPGVTIGANATVGAGAMVRCDVPASATVVGVPAREQ